MDIVEKNFVAQLRFLEDIVNINSGSNNINGINAVADRVLEEISDLGFDVKRYSFEKAGDIIVADFDNKKPKILLLGHMDTVFGADITSKKFCIDGNVITGNGVLDMKGGIAQIVFAIKCMKESGVSLEHIRLMLVGDEEVGHQNSSAVDIMKSYSDDVRLGFCCESGRVDNAFVIKRKGVAMLRLKVFGKASHAGNDYLLGSNAILDLSKKVVKIQGLTSNDLSLTVNVGHIFGGGVTNIVPDYCEAEFDIRFSDMKMYNCLENQIAKVCSYIDVEGSRCEYTLSYEYPPMKEEKNKDLFLLLEQICKDKNYDMPLKCDAGGGADSAFFSMFGVPMLCAFGAKGEHNHTDREYIFLDGLRQRTRLLSDCMMYILEKNCLYEEEV